MKYSAGGHPATRLISQPAGAVLAWVAWRAGLSPNAVTTLAASLSTVGALAYATLPGGFVSIFICILLTQLAYALDCADGQLARATGRSSRLGAWWDVYCDYLALSTLAFAILFRFQRFSHEYDFMIVPCVLFFMFGRIGSLYSSTMARVWVGKDAGEGTVGLLRNTVRAMIDTTVTLFAVCVLRDSPRVLAAYLVIVGGLYCLHGLFVGYRAAAYRQAMPGSQ